jgi:hypothetical protein
MPLDPAHLHLVLNHLPVIGAPLLLLFLVLGLIRRSGELVNVSLALTVALAAATGLVYLTGEPAEEQVERAPWYQERLNERHEDQAVIALAAMLATGAIAGSALVFRRRSRAHAWLSRAAVAGLVVGTALLGWTAWSGGQIRHDEIRDGGAGASTGAYSATPLPGRRDSGR